MFRELTFPSFVRMSRASRRATRRTSERGRLLQTGAVICAALGIDTDLTLIYQLFALLLCIIVISRLSLRVSPPNVSVRRKLPRYATAHEPFEYFIDVINEGDRVERDLSIIDNPIVQPPTIEQFQRRREPGEESRNAYDRWLGFHRFIWLQRLNTGINILQQPVPDVAVQSRSGVRIQATPLRRGVVNFESITIFHPDPFGLNLGRQNFERHEQLLVMPRRYRIPDSFELPGGRHFQPGGASSTWSIGESDEFASLRDYRDGDSMRKIHWPSTARRTKLVVKEYQEEYFVRQALVLDTATEDEDLLEDAISVAASFATRMSNNDAMLDLVYASTKVELLTSGRSTTSLVHQLEALAGLHATNLPFENLSEAVLRHAINLSGMILILVEWSESRKILVERLNALGMAVEVLLVSNTSVDIPSRVHLLEPGNIEEGLARL